MSITILSSDGKRRAVVTEDRHGVQVDYFRSRLVNGHDPLSSAWQWVRSTLMELPFHTALDAVHDIIEEC
jgi:hypothetical protein